MSFNPIFKKTEAMEWTAYVLEAVGISRTSFNKYSEDLQDYITGKFNIFLLLNQIESD